MARILLTAARAQRAAAQYLGAPAKATDCKDVAVFEFRCTLDQRRLLRIWQGELGTVTFQEFHDMNGQPRVEVYKNTYELPAIGPIDFNKPV